MLTHFNGRIFSGLGHPDAPPHWQKCFDLTQVGFGRHDRERIEDAMVGVHLPGQAVQRVEVTLDFKAEQAIRGQGQIHACRTDAQLFDEQFSRLTGPKQPANDCAADFTLSEGALWGCHGVDYAISYANMQNRTHQVDPFLATLRHAVEAKMTACGHKQRDVIAATGIGQSLMSRFMAGGRKRMSPRLYPLCKYAELSTSSHKPLPATEAALSQVVREAIGDNPAAATALIRIVEALVPVLSQIPRPNIQSVGANS